MKFKIVYLYVILAAGVIVTLFILSSSDNKTPQVTAGNIENQPVPDDEVHKGMQNPVGQNPSKSNVSQEVYQKMDNLKKEVESSPGDTVKMREYADFVSAAHRPDEAIKYYEKILDINPKRNDILFSLSMVYFGKQNYDKAEECTNKILKNDKNNTQAMYNLGAIAASKGEKERAKVIWNKLVTDYPGDEASQLAKSSLEKL